MENKNYFNHPLIKNYIKDKIVEIRYLSGGYINDNSPQKLADSFEFGDRKDTCYYRNVIFKYNCDIYDIIEQNKDNDIYKDVIVFCNTKTLHETIMKYPDVFLEKFIKAYVISNYEELIKH